MRWMVLFFVLLALSSDLYGASICTHVDGEWLSRQAPLPANAKIVYKKDHGTLCETVIAVNGELVPLYAGKDFLLVGTLFKEKKVITQETLDSLEDVALMERTRDHEKKAVENERRQLFFKKNLKTLDDLTLFSLKQGETDRFLYVVTDPNCPHCKKLIQDLEIVAFENHLEIKVIIFPVLGPESREMAVQTICEKYLKDHGKDQVPQDGSGCSQADLLLEKTMPFFFKAALSFVPVVISGDGAWVVEGNDISQVKQNLGIGDGDGSDASPMGCAPDPDN